MSQKAARKAVVPDEKEKEKRQTDSPVKDMKKKMAANAEKEKQAAEKSDKPEKPVEKTDKPVEKTEKEKPVEKKTEKEKPVEKKTEKNDKKNREPEKEPVAEKKEEHNKDDKAGKSDKQEQKAHKSKQNGNARVNGATNGDEHNGTVSAPDDDDELMDEDEMFPELAYDSSDPEFEPDAPPRSLTRRSQAKVTRTPETPRPASEKQDPAADDSKESKVLKLKEDVPSTDRKLRSADSPKPPEIKKADSKQEPAKKTQETQDASPEEEKRPQETKENESKEEKQNENKTHEIIVEIEGSEEELRKTDTNYSKSRVKVSPYRRSLRIADQTTSSVMANYTGNNTTMEMDITETSFAEEPSLDDSSFLNGLRNIRGRRSYKPLKEMTLRHVTANKSTRSNVSACEQPSRPTGTVVGRKRRPEAGADVEPGTAADELRAAHSKRMRLLDRLFRRSDGSNDIVGINTDLPLTAPVASADSFDPESLKNVPVLPAAAPVPPARLDAERDGKKCVVM